HIHHLHPAPRLQHRRLAPASPLHRLPHMPLHIPHCLAHNFPAIPHLLGQ
ncbi:unnamed protein product, partial [Closterium sp. NIES-54]